jgi:hypothetical protein
MKKVVHFVLLPAAGELGGHEVIQGDDVRSMRLAFIDWVELRESKLREMAGAQGENHEWHASGVAGSPVGCISDAHENAGLEEAFGVAMFIVRSAGLEAHQFKAAVDVGKECKHGDH